MIRDLKRTLTLCTSQVVKRIAGKTHIWTGDLLAQPPDVLVSSEQLTSSKHVLEGPAHITVALYASFETKYTRGHGHHILAKPNRVNELQVDANMGCAASTSSDLSGWAKGACLTMAFRQPCPNYSPCVKRQRD